MLKSMGPGEGTWRLEVTRGPDVGKWATVEGEPIEIGTSAGRGLVLTDPSVADRHATAEARPDGVLIIDAGGRGGVRFGNRPFERALVPCGGSIMIGSSELLVTFQAQPSLAERRSGVEPVIASEEMTRIYGLVEVLAPVTSTVLITGETGTGKELVAQRLHQHGNRANRPFVRLNCASLPESLLESELFGFERGAFTGADRMKLGLIEAANGGTLFMDEVGELAPSTQAKLLSVLENRTVLRIGSTTEIPVDIRVICATHRDLEFEVERGRFRQDLYYRISTFVLKLPPLRERQGEIRVMSERFARDAAQRNGLREPTFSPDALKVLEAHEWPGNVRELRNAIEHAVVLAGGGPVRPDHLPSSLLRPPPRMHRATRYRAAPSDDVEREKIERVLEEVGGNRTRAAERLGMSRRTLTYKLARYRLLAANG